MPRHKTWRHSSGRRILSPFFTSINEAEASQPTLIKWQTATVFLIVAVIQRSVNSKGGYWRKLLSLGSFEGWNIEIGKGGTAQRNYLVSSPTTLDYVIQVLY